MDHHTRRALTCGPALRAFHTARSPGEEVVAIAVSDLGVLEAVLADPGSLRRVHSFAAGEPVGNQGGAVEQRLVVQMSQGAAA